VDFPWYNTLIQWPVTATSSATTATGAWRREWLVLEQRPASQRRPGLQRSPGRSSRKSTAWPGRLAQHSSPGPVNKLIAMTKALIATCDIDGIPDGHADCRCRATFPVLVPRRVKAQGSRALGARMIFFHLGPSSTGARERAATMVWPRPRAQPDATRRPSLTAITMDAHQLSRVLRLLFQSAIKDTGQRQPRQPLVGPGRGPLPFDFYTRR